MRAESMLFGLLACAAVCVSVEGAEQPKTQQPNIVMIVSDDQGWTDYGFMGHPQIKTPNLDKLAAESLLFRNAYVPCSLCRPSLVTMLSGLYPHQHRITSNDPPLPQGKKGEKANKDPTFLAQRQQMIDNIDRIGTLPKWLGELGYGSFQTGKWWEGDFRRGGFTEGMSQGGRHGDAGLTIGRDGIAPMTDFIDRSVKADKPFFVWYAPMMPHTPHTPPERWLAKYESVAPSPSIAAYWAMCSWFDETCGQLLAHLDARGLRENTLVIYITDNGWIQKPNANGYDDKSKQSPYDGGLRTPLMFRWPGKIAPRENANLAISIDIPCTVLPIVGLKQTAEMQGVNLLDEAAVDARKTIYGECFEHNAVDIERPVTSLKWRWCIDGHTKLILPHAPNVEAPAELYDLQADPHEERDLAEEHPEDIARLTKKINSWWAAQ
jgi:uncharacterized sulfatase